MYEKGEGREGGGRRSYAVKRRGKKAFF